MDRNRWFALVILVVAFAGGVLVPHYVEGGITHRYWDIFELMVLVAALIFQLPGAAVSVTAAILVGIFYLRPLDANTFVAFVRVAAEGGIVGWFAQQQRQQQEYLGRMLMVDRLTGLHNYSYFIDRLSEERKRADRFGSKLSLVMIDIDHFKPFNDQYGHRSGNELLKQLAAVFQAQVRAVDIVSRYGGEEFAALLPNTGAVAAAEVAERIRESVEKTAFTMAGGGAVNKTVSAGVACYPADSTDELELIDRADEALYLAKEGGRNRVVVFSAEKGPKEVVV